MRAGATRTVGVLLERNVIAYRGAWKLFVTGFAEPVLYLFSIGVGVGRLVESFTVDGRTIGYAAFVAPGMLAASAMNGALLDATFNLFFKLRYLKLYDQILTTPVGTVDIARGELAWCLLRGTIYSTAFLAVMAMMGTTASWWALAALPAATLIAFAFGAVGMALTTYMSSWQDFDKVTLVTLPLFLFSGTFFPVSAFPPALRWLVEVTPLYRGVVLCRELVLGTPSTASVISVAYLVGLGLLGLVMMRRRLDALLRV